MTCYPNSLALHRQGISREEAVELIGTVVVNEIYNILKQNENFDRKRFVAALRQLPELPHDKERRIFPRRDRWGRLKRAFTVIIM